MFRFLSRSLSGNRVLRSSNRVKCARHCSFKSKVLSVDKVYSCRSDVIDLNKHFRCNFYRSFASNAYPEHTIVGLPALSPTMESGTIKAWEKREGDKLEEGDLLALIETDKATMDFETPEEGYLARILVEAGTVDVKLGKAVCIIVENEADVAAFKGFKIVDDVVSSGGKESAQVETQAVASDSSESDYPEHVVVNLPALSPTVESSTIKSWAVKEGDKLSEGDLIASVETDKAVIDWTHEDTDEVYVAKILKPGGSSDVKVGEAVSIFVDELSKVEKFKNYRLPAPASAVEAKPVETKAETQTSAKPKPTKPVIATSFAKTVAAKKGVDLSQVEGSSHNGLVLARDVQEYARKAPAVKKVAKKLAGPAPTPTSASYTDILLSSVRKVIAKRLLESKSTIPHYYLSVGINMDECIKFRTSFNKLFQTKISINDIVIKSAAMACTRVPECNSAWLPDSIIRQYNSSDISVAVQTSNGLITPIVFNADSKGLLEINNDVLTLASKAKENKLKPEEFQGGSFTVSNLGMFGIKRFSAVINPPQSCILAVGGAETVVERKSGQVVFSKVMSVTLSCDYRVVDGAIGAQWLKEFKAFMESPALMLF